MADFITERNSRGVPSFLVPATIEIVPISVHWAQPVQLPEITILHDFLPWYSTNFSFVASLWSQYYCAHFTDMKTETDWADRKIR